MESERPPAERDEGPSEADIARAERVAHRESGRSPGGRRVNIWLVLGLALGVIFVASLLIDLLVFVPRGRQDGPVGDALEQATVTRVIDGESIAVRVGDREVTVRYIGVGAPALGDSHAGAAVAANRQLVSGREVMLGRDTQDKDELGRLLRYVFVDGTMVNAVLIASGYVRATDPGDNQTFEAEFRRLEAEARGEGRGIWSALGGAQRTSLDETDGGLVVSGRGPGTVNLAADGG